MRYGVNSGSSDDEESNLMLIVIGAAALVVSCVIGYCMYKCSERESSPVKIEQLDQREMIVLSGEALEMKNKIGQNIFSQLKLKGLDKAKNASIFNQKTSRQVKNEYLRRSRE